MTDTDLDRVVDDLAFVRIHTTPQHCEPGECLIEPGTTHKEVHTHRTTTTTPALLTLLQDAITASIGGSTSGASLAFERSILDADALEKATHVTAAIESWCRIAGARFTRTDLPGSLSAWRVRWKSFYAEDAATDWYVSELRGWLGFILTKLDRPVTYRVPIACPVCDCTRFLNGNGNADIYPIEITYRREAPIRTARARCLATGCGATWDTYYAIEELGTEVREKAEGNAISHVVGREDER